MTEKEYEAHLDTVDRLSLQKKFTLAFEYINFTINNLFYPEEYNNLKDLVKLNALKHGITLK